MQHWILSIAGMLNGKRKIYDSDLDKLRIWDISVCRLKLLASWFYIPFRDTSYYYVQFRRQDKKFQETSYLQIQMSSSIQMPFFKLFPFMGCY